MTATGTEARVIEMIASRHRGFGIAKYGPADGRKQPTSIAPVAATPARRVGLMLRGVLPTCDSTNGQGIRRWQITKNHTGVSTAPNSAPCTQPKMVGG
jgi:hypothetical protein